MKWPVNSSAPKTQNARRRRVALSIASGTKHSLGMRPHNNYSVYFLPTPQVEAGNEPVGVLPEVLRRLTRPESAVALSAMRLFLSKGDETAFGSAIGDYLTAVRTREEPIEMVLAVCCELAVCLEGQPLVTDDVLMRPTRMHELIFACVLRSFYGEVVVERAIGARAQRKADARQHSQSGTWPRRPAY
jgi:hypothetical protein